MDRDIGLDFAGELPGGGARVVVAELAKSERSTCKVCRVRLPKGAPRVGVQCWMQGRTMTGWVHVDCFTDQLSFDIAPSGRGKCKHSGEKFIKGEVRFAVCAHLKIYVKLSAADSCLETAASYFGPGFSLKDVEGYDSLTKGQQDEVASAMSSFPFLAGQPAPPGGSTNAVKPPGASNKKNKQSGNKTNKSARGAGSGKRRPGADEEEKEETQENSRSDRKRRKA